MAIFWPGDLLKPQNIMADVAPRNLRGPSASNGFTQVVSNSSGIWTVTYESVPVYTPAMIKAWRAVASQAEGQANPIVIPVYDWQRAPVPSGLTIQNFCANVENVPYDDDASFDDGTYFQGNYIEATVAAPAAIGAIQIAVNKGACADLEPGQRFSINHRLYEIKSVVAQNATTATIKLNLPLREAIETYNVLEFARPTVKVRLASDNEMMLPLNFNRQSFTTVKFVEYF